MSDTKQRYIAPWLVRYGSLMALTGKLKGLQPSDDLSSITCDTDPTTTFPECP